MHLDQQDNEKKEIQIKLIKRTYIICLQIYKILYVIILF